MNAEQAARAKGWTSGGDGPIIYNTQHYDSWKAAISWSPGDGPIYSTWAECCEAEEIEHEPDPAPLTEEQRADMLDKIMTADTEAMLKLAQTKPDDFRSAYYGMLDTHVWDDDVSDDDLRAALQAALSGITE